MTQSTLVVTSRGTSHSTKSTAADIIALINGFKENAHGGTREVIELLDMHEAPGVIFFESTKRSIDTPTLWISNQKHTLKCRVLFTFSANELVFDSNFSLQRGNFLLFDKAFSSGMYCLVKKVLFDVFKGAPTTDSAFDLSDSDDSHHKNEISKSDKINTNIVTKDVGTNDICLQTGENEKSVLKEPLTENEIFSQNLEKELQGNIWSEDEFCLHVKSARSSGCDRIISFFILDNKIWMRTYVIDKGIKEIGPRIVFEIEKIMKGTLKGDLLYKSANPLMFTYKESHISGKNGQESKIDQETPTDLETQVENSTFTQSEKKTTDLNSEDSESKIEKTTLTQSEIKNPGLHPVDSESKIENTISLQSEKKNPGLNQKDTETNVENTISLQSEIKNLGLNSEDSRNSDIKEPDSQILENHKKHDTNKSFDGESTNKETSISHTDSQLNEVLSNETNSVSVISTNDEQNVQNKKPTKRKSVPTQNKKQKATTKTSDKNTKDGPADIVKVDNKGSEGSNASSKQQNNGSSDQNMSISSDTHADADISPQNENSSIEEKSTKAETTNKRNAEKPQTKAGRAGTPKKTASKPTPRKKK